MKKTWRQKLEDKASLPKVLKLERAFPCYSAVDKMGAEAGDEVALVNPSEVVDTMKQVPEGKLTTINEIREALAAKHGATIGCPMTTGIFAWVAAHAAQERSLEGEKETTPYWRTLKAHGVINEKYPGGVEKQRKLLEKEGHNVVQKGRKHRVLNYEKSLMKLAAFKEKT